ncbi:MAG TPA: tetratricopeptide repeat protein [Steroidobacteraceae bacterium]|nr:tetratricopeptide repeat protein [Steroidobacteraceae bacterium]
MDISRAAGGHAVIGVLAISILSACGSAQSRLAAHMSRGQAYFATGDYPRAGIEFRDALQIDPKSTEALIMTGKVAEKLQNLRGAVGLYQAAVDAQPGNAEASADLARLLVLGGAPEQAERVLEPALRTHPNDPALLTLRAAARDVLGNQAGAVADADRALKLAPTNLEAIQVRAGLYRHAGDLAGALALVSRGTAKHPESTELREALVDLYSAAGQPARAERELHALIALAPREPRYRFQLADFDLHQHRLNDAQQALEQGVKSLPQDNNLKLGLVSFVSAQRTRAQGEQLLRGFIAREPDNYDLRLGLGALLERSGAVKEATETYQEIVRRDGTGPKGLIARDRLARIALAQSRPDDAAELIAQVLKESPRDNDALVLHGEMALARSNTAAAITDFRTVLRDQPRAAQIYRLLAAALVASGDTALAEESLRNAIDVAPADATLRIELAQTMLKARQIDQAVTVLEEATQRAPGDAIVRQELAIADLAKHDYAAAASAAQDLERLRPKAPAGAYLAGLAAEGAKQNDDAERDFERALSLEPRAYDPLAALAQLMLARGQAAQAVAHVKSASDAGPPDAHLLNLLGEMYLAERNATLAADAFVRASVAQPNWWVPYRNLALARITARDISGAIAAYQAGIKVAPTEPQPLTELALLYESHGRPDDAIALYQDWHRKAPRSQMVSENLARLLIRYRSDRPSLDEARDLTASFNTSSDGSLLDTNGWVHFKRAEYAEALPVLQRAVERQPDSREFRYHLGMAELHSGNSADARRDLQSALAGSARFAGADDARAALAALGKSSG